MALQLRDGWDDHMAVYANKYFNIHCPKCKKEDCWDPYPEQELKGIAVKTRRKKEDEIMG